MIPERRYADFRVAGRVLVGAALVYGDIAPQFRERFVPGALAPVAPVALTLQHDSGMVILDAGAFVLTDGPRALEVRAELPEGSAALELVKRAALTGFSIEFTALAETRQAGIRVVERAELTGLSLVDRGAYPLSTAEVRCAQPAANGLPVVWL